MRVRIKGEHDSAMAIRGLLTRAGIFKIVERWPHVDIVIEQTRRISDDDIVIDTLAGRLESEIVNGIERELRRHNVTCHILLERTTGIQHSRKVRIAIPYDNSLEAIVEMGVADGMIRYAQARL